MKYHIKKFEFISKSNTQKVLKAKRRADVYLTPLPPVHQHVWERISLDTLFEFAALPEAKKPSAAKRARLYFLRLAAVLKERLKSALLSCKGQDRFAFFAGSLCAAACVCLLSAATVVVGLFGRFMLPYREIVVPSVVGKYYTELEDLGGESIRFLIDYESSDTVPAGTVISQHPKASVMRKLSGKNKFCTVTVSVSSGKSFYKVEDLAGQDKRDALLHLRNAGVALNVVEQHSDTVQKGKVISTLPKSNERLYSGQTLTVYVSLGKQISAVRMPDLYALSEAQAARALETRGLKLGRISYATSSADAGKVIYQQYAAFSSVPAGTTVDITVSLGSLYEQKTVPNLYGLTVSEATARLEAVGLVLGQIYSVTSGAPKGTVISQTPIPNTAISATTISVDIYVSS